MSEIPFGDLAREYRDIKPEIDRAVARVLKSGWFVLGPEVEKFERDFAAAVGSPFSVGVASGTEAIALALMAIGVGPGDQVITVAHTAVPTVTGISMTGATPRFVECRGDTCLINVARVAAAITPHTKAILPVHLYGQCVEMEPLLALAAQHKLPIIEDCAQATGATSKNRAAGTMGVMGCFSFYPSKNLGCYGDGGAITVSDPKMADSLRMLRNYGQKKRYHHVTRGINSRLDELQAAILGAKLPHVNAWNERRRQIAARYTEGLRGLPLQLPVEAPGQRHVYHLYVVQTPRRDDLQSHLTTKKVQTLIHYPIPVHRQEAYAVKQALPTTERVAGEVLSLPMYPQLTDDEVERVIKAVREFFG